MNCGKLSFITAMSVDQSLPILLLKIPELWDEGYESQPYPFLLLLQTLTRLWNRVGTHVNAGSRERLASLSSDTLVLIMWYADFNTEPSGTQTSILESANHRVGSHVTNQT